MNDIPGAAGKTVVCPLCRSKNCERVTFGGLAFRCSTCGIAFDEHGARIAFPEETDPVQERSRTERV